MAFDLTANLNVQASTRSLNQLRRDIDKSLKTVGIDVKTANLRRAKKDVDALTKSTKEGAKAANGFQRALRLRTQDYLAYATITALVVKLGASISNATKDAIRFEAELAKIAQVTNRSNAEIKEYSSNFLEISKRYGVAQTEVAKLTRTLSQAGFSFDQALKGAERLSRTSLLATFTNLESTTEALIATTSAFSLSIDDAADSLEAINAVTKRFAVEADDIVDAIKRTGGAFASAGGQINELIALFTSVRSFSRESAETIATGFRTIFGRVQRPRTIQYFRELGIELETAEGKFVGAFEAIRRISEGLERAGIVAGDLRFAEVVEQLGGIRQISRVIPLLTNFENAQKALTIANAGVAESDLDVAKAKETLSFRLRELETRFKAVFTELSQTQGFKLLVDVLLQGATAAVKFAEGLNKLADQFAPLVPLLTGFAAFRAGKFLSGAFKGTGVQGFASGGFVPGTGNRDTVPAMLTPGEFVIRKSSVNKIGPATLAAMNENGFNDGGRVLKQNGEPNSGFQKFLARNKLVPFGTKFSTLPEERRKDLEDQYRKEANIGGGSLQTAVLKPKRVEGLFLRKGQDRQENFTVNIPSVKGKESPVFGGARKLSARIKANLLPEKAAGAFQDDIRAGLRLAVGSSANKIGKGLGIDPLVDVDEKRAAEEAKNSISKIDLKGVEGVVFEALISNITGTALSEVGSTFDLVNPDKANKSRLSKLFGSSIDARYLEAKRSFGTDSLTGSANSIANKIITAGNTGLLGRDDFDFKNSGGGISGSDTVPAMLTPGEFVINKSAAQQIGYSNLSKMNRSGVAGFNAGGPVAVQKFQDGGGVLPGLDLGTAFEAGAIIFAINTVTDAFKKLTGPLKSMRQSAKSSSQSLFASNKERKNLIFGIKLRQKQIKAERSKIDKLISKYGDLRQDIIKSGRVITASDKKKLANYKAEAKASKKLVAAKRKELRSSLDALKNNRARKLGKKARGAIEDNAEIIGAGAVVGIIAAFTSGLKKSTETLEEMSNKALEAGDVDTFLANKRKELAQRDQQSEITRTAAGGGALGGIIGTAVGGPIGTIVGSIIGSLGGALIGKFTPVITKFTDLIGLTNSELDRHNELLKAENEARDISVGKLTSEAQNRFNRINESGNDKLASSLLLRDLKNIRSKSFVGSAQDAGEAARERFNQQLQQLAPSIESSFKRLSKEANQSGLSFSEFAKQNKFVVDLYKKLIVTQEGGLESFNNTINAFNATSRAVVQLRAKFLQSIQALQNSIIQQQNFDRSLQAFSDRTSQRERNNDALDIRSQALSGGNVNVGSLRLGGALNQNSAGSQEFIKTLNDLNRIGGPLVQQQIQQYRQISSILPGFQRGLLNTLQNTNESNRSAKITQFIEQTFAGLPQTIRSKIVKLFDDIDDKTDPATLLTKLKEAEQIATSLNLGNIENARQALERDQNSIANSVRRQNELAQQFNQVTLSTIDGLNTINDAFREIPAGFSEIQQRQSARAQIQTNNTGIQFSGNNVADAQTIARNRAVSVRELERLQRSGQGALQPQRVAELQDRIARLGQAFDTLTNTSELLSAVQEDFRRQEEQRTTKKGFAEDLTFGTRQFRTQQAQLNQIGNFLGRGGSIQAIPEQFRGEVRGFLERFREIPLFNGQTGQQIIDDQTRRFLRNIGVRPEEIDRIMERTRPVEVQILRQLEQINAILETLLILHRELLDLNQIFKI